MTMTVKELRTLADDSLRSKLEQIKNETMRVLMIGSDPPAPPTEDDLNAPGIEIFEGIYTHTDGEDGEDDVDERVVWMGIA